MTWFLRWTKPNMHTPFLYTFGGEVDEMGELPRGLEGTLTERCSGCRLHELEVEGIGQLQYDRSAHQSRLQLIDISPLVIDKENVIAGPIDIVDAESKVHEVIQAAVLDGGAGEPLVGKGVVGSSIDHL